MGARKHTGRLSRRARASRRSRLARAHGSYAVPAVFVDRMTEILRKHGYDPKVAWHLAREGMRPEELEHRIRSTKPGAVGSLEYTHGLHKLGPAGQRTRKMVPAPRAW